MLIEILILMGPERHQSGINTCIVLIFSFVTFCGSSSISDEWKIEPRVKIELQKRGSGWLMFCTLIPF